MTTSVSTSKTEVEVREDGSITSPDSPGVVWVPHGVDPPRKVGDEKDWWKSKEIRAALAAALAGVADKIWGYLENLEIDAGTSLIAVGALWLLLRFMTSQPVTRPGRPVLQPGDVKGHAK